MSGPLPCAADLRLRPATLADSSLLLRWANDPDTRSQAFNTAPIPVDTHESWLTRRLQDAGCLIGLLESADGTPLGQVRFDATADGLEVDISVDRAWRGRGIGRELLRQGLAAAARRWPAGTRVIAFVLTSNPASQRIFERCEFTRAGVEARHGRDAIRYTRSI